MTSVTLAPAARRGAAFRQGVRDTLPFVVGAVPFALIFGALAPARGFTIVQTLVCSALVFSGSAQFIAINLLVVGADATIIWLASLVVSLRHVLYTMALLPGVRHLGIGWRLPLAAALTDETFAVVEARARGGSDPAHGHWHFLGSCAVLWGSWQAATATGVLLGAGVPALRGWGLEFAMVATFIGIVVPALRTPPFWGAMTAAGIVAAIARPLPYQSGLLVAAAAGIAAGVLLESRRAR